MKAALAQIGAIALALASPSLQAQTLKDAQPTLKIGNWTVLRSIDTMTDKVTCTGIYKTNYGIQLAGDGLYVTVRGGIQGITLRFGENSARPLRLPQKMEKDVNAVIIQGGEFSEALQANRLRLEVLTLIRGLATEDLDTTGIQTAVDHIRAGCPVSAEAAAVTKPASPSDSLCSELLLSRLRAAGVTDQQINAACRR